MEEGDTEVRGLSRHQFLGSPLHAESSSHALSTSASGQRIANHLHNSECAVLVLESPSVLDTPLKILAAGF